jgi:hypothetical protein
LQHANENGIRFKNSFTQKVFIMAKTQLISGFTLASARADLSTRAQRMARERKLLSANVEEITLAMDLIKAIAKKAKGAVADSADFHAYGNIEADCYWESDSKVYVRSTITVKGLALDDMAFKKALGYAKLAGFDFGEDGVEKCVDSWNAGLSAVGKKPVSDKVSARIELRLRLKDKEEGATCERVQVGTVKREVEEAVYELVCH